MNENHAEYVERKREEARRHYHASIARLTEGTATTPCVAGPRITLHDGRYYVDPTGRVWTDGRPPEGLVGVAQETALALAVAYDLDAYGVVVVQMPKVPDLDALTDEYAKELRDAFGTENPQTVGATDGTEDEFGDLICSVANQLGIESDDDGSGEEQWRRLDLAIGESEATTWSGLLADVRAAFAQVAR
jgi:hypothetical protein